MRRIIMIVLAVPLLATAVWAVRSGPAPASATVAGTATHQVRMAVPDEGDSPALAAQLAKARLATARYAINLQAAKAAGYQILTQMIPDMGFHFINPTITGFDITKPPILVYEHHGDSWQLGAFEWTFTAKPATPPLPGATFGTFGAACHYKDGTFVFKPSQADCPKRSPLSGAAFFLWHPDLVTMHVWLWYPNPVSLYNGTNPYVHPFNNG